MSRSFQLEINNILKYRSAIETKVLRIDDNLFEEDRDNLNDSLKMNLRKYVESLLQLYRLENEIQNNFTNIVNREFKMRDIITWSIINNTQHHDDESKLGIKTLIDNVKSFSENIILLLITQGPFALKFDYFGSSYSIDEMKVGEKSKEQIYITRALEVNNNYRLYEFVIKGKNQEKYLYTNPDQILFSDYFYEVEINSLNVETNYGISSDGLNYKLDKWKMISIIDGKIPMEFHEVINKIIENFQMPVLNFFNIYKNDTENKDSKKLIDLLLYSVKKYYDSLNSRKKSINGEFLIFLFSLKIPHSYWKNKKIEFVYNMTSVKYEYWTKNPHNFSLELWERETFFEIIENSKITLLKECWWHDKQGPFHAKRNLLIEIEMNSKKQYFLRDITEDDFIEIKKQEFFNPDHDDYALMKSNGNFYFKKTKNLLEKIIRVEKAFIEKKHTFDNSLLSNVKYNSNVTNVKSIIENGITIINSPAGYGKTALAADTIRVLNSIQESGRILFLAPTYKATKVIKELDGDAIVKTSTIQKIKFSDNYKLIEKYESIIIDEYSMINDDDWEALFDALLEHKDTLKRVVMMGDKNQIPPIISSGLHRLILKKFSDYTITLTVNHRQKGHLAKSLDNFYENKIISHENFKECIYRYETLSDFSSKIIDLNLNDYKILTPINYGPFGRFVMNSIISKSDNRNGEFKVGDEIVVDKTISDTYDNSWKDIICVNETFTIGKIENDYIGFTFRNKELKNQNIGNGFRIKNGWLQMITDGSIPEDEWIISPANAITYHSSQGSTYDKVAVVIPVGSKILFENIYTALSRVRGSDKNNLKILIHSTDVENYIDKNIKSAYE